MIKRIVCAVGLISAMGTIPIASASSMDAVKEQASGVLSGQQSSSSGVTSLLSALSSGSFNLGSMSNVAGVLGYCQQQGYTQSATQTLKDKLMSKIGGEDQASQQPDYQQGLKGILLGNDEGKRFDLGGLKDRLGEKACTTVADQAMSRFLGG